MGIAHRPGEEGGGAACYSARNTLGMPAHLSSWMTAACVSSTAAAKAAESAGDTWGTGMGWLVTTMRGTLRPKARGGPGDAQRGCVCRHGEGVWSLRGRGGATQVRMAIAAGCQAAAPPLMHRHRHRPAAAGAGSVGQGRAPRPGNQQGRHPTHLWGNGRFQMPRMKPRLMRSLRLMASQLRGPHWNSRLFPEGPEARMAHMWDWGQGAEAGAAGSRRRQVRQARQA